MSNILALIHNDSLSVSEAIVATADCIEMMEEKIEIHNQCKGETTHRYETLPFQTSKDLKTLESQFKKKGYAVHLHEGKKLHFRSLRFGEIYEDNKPLMLAVFAPDKLVRELI